VLSKSGSPGLRAGGRFDLARTADFASGLWPAGDRFGGATRVSTRRGALKNLESFAVRHEGAFYQWREVPSRELSIALVADERFGRVTGWIEAS
jgi:hypothetical protein